jgi:hypothetical protein
VGTCSFDKGVKKKYELNVKSEALRNIQFENKREEIMDAMKRRRKRAREMQKMLANFFN